MKPALILTFGGLLSLLPAQTAKKPAQPQGTVHIYRELLEIGKLTRPTVSCDNFPVARIENGRIYTMKMSVGRHALGTTDHPVGFFIDVEAGKEYFVRIDFPVNASLPSGAAPVLVPVEEGRMETMKLKPLDARYIETGTCGS
jgi:hypothetical protein